MINITKGWPNMYAVDLAIPVGDTAIVEGMAISVSSSNMWVRGVPRGRVGYVTGPQQFPTAFDVARVQQTTFSNEGYPAGVGEVGRQNMGGISLTNPIEFQTDQYSGSIAGQVVYSPDTGADAGKFVQATATTHQILGWCRSVQSDLTGGNSTIPNWQGGITVATIVAAPVLLLP